MTDLPTGPDRDEERLRRMLHTGPIEPLAPDAGNFDRIVTRARRRKQRRIGAVLGVFVLVAGAGLGVGVLSNRGPDTLSQQAGSGSSATPSSGSSTPTTSRSPAPSASASPSGGSDGGGSSGLPAGGPVPPDFAVSSVTTVAGGVSYALGTAPCSSSICTSMVRTTDGGKTWKGLRPPRVALAGTGTFPVDDVQQIRFANSRDGWLYGGALYATHDGGASWTKISVPAPSVGVVTALATDGTTAYAVTNSCTASSQDCASPRLLAAPVGSNSFQPVSGVSVGGTTGATGSISLGGGGITQLGSDVFVRSGSSWHAATTVPCDGGAALSGVASAASGSTVFAFCGGGGAGQLYLDAYASTDGGRSWHARTSSGAEAHVSNGVLSVTAESDRVLAVASASPGTGSAVQLSTDGGATWSAASLPSSANGWTYVAAGGGGRVVAISAAGTLYVSTDNGSSWGAVAIHG